MSKNDFLFLLLGVSYTTLKLSEKALSQKLSSDFRFDVHLNMSFDEVQEYPEDDNIINTGLHDKEVINLIHRSGKLPLWIDISIREIKEDCTIFQLNCCGRYSNDANDFYYKERGSGPFGIKILSM